MSKLWYVVLDVERKHRMNDTLCLLDVRSLIQVDLTLLLIFLSCPQLSRTSRIRHLWAESTDNQLANL